MGLPSKLKDMDIFADGNSWRGKTGEVTLPVIKAKTEAWRGGGMLGEVDIRMGLEKLEMEVKVGGFAAEAISLLAGVGVGGAMMRFLGAYQEDILGGILRVELVTRGAAVEYNPGSAKPAGNTEEAIKLTLSYYKMLVNDRTRIEIDIMNNIYIVDGVDLNAGIRAALQQ